MVGFLIFNTSSERPISKLSENHKINVIGPTELKLWLFKDTYNISRVNFIAARESTLRIIPPPPLEFLTYTYNCEYTVCPNGVVTPPTHHPSRTGVLVSLSTAWPPQSLSFYMTVPLRACNGRERRRLMPEWWHISSTCGQVK